MSSPVFPPKLQIPGRVYLSTGCLICISSSIYPKSNLKYLFPLNFLFLQFFYAQWIVSLYVVTIHLQRWSQRIILSFRPSHNESAWPVTQFNQWNVAEVKHGTGSFCFCTFGSLELPSKMSSYPSGESLRRQRGPRSMRERPTSPDMLLPSCLHQSPRHVIKATLDVLAQAAGWPQAHERAQARPAEPSSWAPSTDRIMRNNKSYYFSH